MTDEQVGKYIRLLCAQFDCGHLTEEHMIMICKSYDNHIFSKFVKDHDGRYYNERLEIEKFKRKKFCESRGKNREGKKNISNSYVPHMENENENINTTNVSSSGKKFFSRNMEFGKRFSETETQIEHALKTFKNNGLKPTKENILHMLRAFVSEIESKADSKNSFTDFSSHFISWCKVNKQLQLQSKSRIGL